MGVLAGLFKHAHLRARRLLYNSTCTGWMTMAKEERLVATAPAKVLGPSVITGSVIEDEDPGLETAGGFSMPFATCCHAPPNCRFVTCLKLVHITSFN